MNTNGFKFEYNGNFGDNEEQEKLKESEDKLKFNSKKLDQMIQDGKITQQDKKKILESQKSDAIKLRMENVNKILAPKIKELKNKELKNKDK